jgi:UDP-glucose:(heptosyl)LPS alpha-1,3-glucosyltransferase
MHLALVRRRFSPTGGAEHYLQRLADGLAARGHRVTIVCESWHNDRREGSSHEIRAIPTDDPVSFAKSLAAHPLRPDFDLVFSLERAPGADIYRAGDGIHAEWMARRADYSPWLGNLRNLVKSKNQQVRELEAQVFDARNTGWVIANSEMVRTGIERHFAFPRERIRVIRNGVPYDRFSSGNRERGRRTFEIAEDTFVVLLVGSGEERKGVRFAREAVARVAGARFLLIDSPPPCPIEDAYAAADVFLLPSLYDPFANVTLEALAAGLPVITTVHNGGSEILDQGRNGFVLERADDIDGMTQKLKLLREPAARASFREPAQACARIYDLRRNIDETLALCETVAQSR